MFRKFRIWPYCEIHNLEATYLHIPFKNIAHNTDHLVAEEFFNLGMDEELESEFLDKSKIQYVRGCGADNEPSVFFRKNPNQYKLVADKFLRKMNATVKPDILFTKEKISVAVHIRRGDLCNTDNNFQNRGSSDEYYLLAMQKIIEDNPKKEIEFFIFSESPEKRKNKNEKFKKSVKIFKDLDIFSKFRKLNTDQYKLFIDGDPYFAMWHMINSDYLVASKGCFSGLYSLILQRESYICHLIK